MQGCVAAGKVVMSMISLANGGAALYFALLRAWIALAVMTAISIIGFNIRAPYGRHHSADEADASGSESHEARHVAAASKKCAVLGMQTLIRITIRSDLAWFLWEIPNVLIMAAYWLRARTCAGAACAPNRNAFTIAGCALAAMFCSHYVHRAIIYPLRMRAGAKRMPLVMMLVCAVWCICNSYFLARGLFAYSASFAPQEHRSARFQIGVLFWACGLAINVDADNTLRALRPAGCSSAYAIPHGKLFSFVSCPNYFGEIIEWCGFAVAARDVHAAAAFALWTAATLLPRAMQHHRWYLARFQSYAALRRKACIPCVL